MSWDAASDAGLQAQDGVPPAAAAVRTHRVFIATLAREFEAREDETLLAAARRAGVRIVAACGGRGSCGSCMVRISAGRVHRDGAGNPRTWLRACRISARSALEVELAPRSLAPVVRADVRSGGDDAALPLEPLVAEATAACSAASLADPVPDAERVRRALAATQPALAAASVDAAAAAELPPLLRAHDWRVSARWRLPLDAAIAVEAQAEVRSAGGAPRLIGFARPDAPLLGLAVDLGTTNAAAFLLDLKTGMRLASLGLENPQVAWGADLISRINHAAGSPAVAARMRAAAVAGLDALAHDLARAVGAEPGDIADIAVCGNTAMQHLLAGWPVAQLGRAPFVAVTHDAVDLPARALGLHVAAGANVHLAASIGGFVGGDHVAALLATEALWSQPGTTLVMDVGTNTEISLVQGDRLWSTSCPSGPALEGGHIASGMRAAEGAIERVRIDDGVPKLGVIGGARPVGLCGSGVLDALAAFVGAGWIDARGRIRQHARIVDGVRAITLVEEIDDTPAVRFTQHDVRAVQLAKSAIRTGVQLLCTQAGTHTGTIDRVLLAGAFGAYLDIGACIAIGLLPPLPRERVQQVGNAAGLGVQQMLASRTRRARAAAIARRCRCVELSARSDFQKTFLQHIGFET
ncbi:MAG TPA: ASKHA domain-containing protein [Rubrivivax sp.]|nr:ASKHA domain-containing protein [Burkholderiales bacterium]HNT38211.1 ASKHA domain-containing protein [Rubrivivax sp.]